MALNIKDAETERLASEVARLTGESKTQAVKRALIERRERLALRGRVRNREKDIRELLEEEIWPQVPAGLQGNQIDRET
jgi:antitoxin VapB